MGLGPSKNSNKRQKANRHAAPSVNNNDDEASNNTQRPLPIAPQQFVIVLFNYKQLQSDELTIKKGERLELLAKDDSGWWKAKLGDRVGLIPSNYVRLDDDSPENTDGYMNVCRREAERLLLLPYVQHGQYIVRPSTEANNLALSVRVQEEATPVIKNFKIQVSPNHAVQILTKNPNVSNKQHFDNVRQLLEYYNQHDGLGCRLVAPCPRTRPPNVPLHAVEVPRNCIEEDTLLGSGNFGEVFLGRLYRTVEVAIKKPKTGQMTKEKLLAEAESLHKVVHDRIVQLIGVCTEEMPLLIITEYMPNGDLLAYLQAIRAKPFNQNAQAWNSPFHRFSSQVSMLIQVVSAMEHLESLNILHRDLRAANILVGHNDEVKVADFGLAKLLEASDVYIGSANSTFPWRWAAPEVLINYCFSIKSDVWSFGVLAYEVITMGCTPYGSKDNDQVIENVKKRCILEFPHDGAKTFCPPSFYRAVMVACLRFKPEERTTFHQLRSIIDQYEPFADEKRFIDPEDTLQSERPLRNPSAPAGERYQDVD